MIFHSVFQFVCRLLLLPLTLTLSAFPFMLKFVRILRVENVLERIASSHVKQEA